MGALNAPDKMPGHIGGDPSQSRHGGSFVILKMP